jgi:hypothetical protein
MDKIRIVETPRGWLNTRTSRYHKTAVGALAAVRRYDKQKAASSTRPIVTMVEWDTKTAVGLSVVKAITGQ